MPEASSSLSPTKVLVVDDSSVIRLAIQKMLRTEFNVLTAEDGEAGWQQLVQDDQIKVLITDIEMPRLDGYGFICRARAAEVARIRDLPIIAITGAEDAQTKARAYACGATDFITKPLDKARLQARVTAYAQFDELTRELDDSGAADDLSSDDDPLTQLRSRKYFLSRGAQDLAQALAQSRNLGLVRLDIDGFKDLYKEFGDEAIDQTLARLAGLMRDHAGTGNTVARVGGAEFALMLPAISHLQAVELCERLRTVVANEPFQLAGRRIPLSLSIGLVSLEQDPVETVHDLLMLAEQRLSHAKSEGGNRVSTNILGESVLEFEEVTLAPPVELASTNGEEGEFYQEPVFDGAEPQATSVPSDLVSIDKALQLIGRGEGERLTPYLSTLVAQVLPLLALYGEQSDADTQSCVEKLKQRLRSDE